MRTHRIALGACGVLLILYALTGFLLVPRIAHDKLESYVAETLHRPVTLGDLRFNPFTFTAQTRDFNLTETDGTPLVAFRQLTINFELASLWHRALHLKEVRLDAPDVRLVVSPERRLNLAQLIPARAAMTQTEPAEPPRVRIGALSVRDGRISVEDHSSPELFRTVLTPIRFVLADFRTDAGYENLYRFTGRTVAGEQFDWSGSFTVQPLASTGRFNFQNLRLAELDAYLCKALPFRLVDGRVTLHATYGVKLDPFDAELELSQAIVRELSLAERSSGEPQMPVSVPELAITDGSFSYARRNVALGRVDIKRGRVNAQREADGSLNLERLLTPVPSSSEGTSGCAVEPSPDNAAPAADTPKAAQWQTTIAALRITDAAIVAEDRSMNPTARMELAPVTLSIDHVSTKPEVLSRLEANIAINQAGRLHASGSAQLQPLRAQLTLDLKDLDLTALQPYLEQTTALTLYSGKLAAQGKLDFSAPEGQPPSLEFKGDMQVASLGTTDRTQKQDLVKWHNLAASDIHLQRNPNRLSIARIVAREPYARVIITENRELNIANVLGKDAGADAKESGAGRAQAARSSPAESIRIGTVQIVNGSAHFADHSIEPSFAASILDLNGSIVGLSSAAAARAKVRLKGSVDRYAPVDISGATNILAEQQFADLRMNFRNIELTTFNPYSGKFAGYHINKGKLSTELHYQVTGRKLDAAHHIVLDNLEFGEKTDSKDAAPIPMKLAVALLKDRKGIIELQLPVSGDLSDPHFRLGPVLWQTFLGLLKKVVTSPFAALGALFGSGDELAHVDFQPGAADLSRADTSKLGRLAAALIERPQLRLNVPATSAAPQDSAALAQVALDLRVTVQAPDRTDTAAVRARLKRAESVYRDITKSAPTYPPETLVGGEENSAARLEHLERALLERLQPDANALAQLGRERAAAVQNAVVGRTGLDPQRVFITTDRPAAVTPEGAVRMEMKLE